ncbi:Hypothetical predicted protein, partial [Pelobates cultripes]
MAATAAPATPTPSRSAAHSPTLKMSDLLSVQLPSLVVPHDNDLATRRDKTGCKTFRKLFLQIWESL